jgi:hypothetical protein
VISVRKHMDLSADELRHLITEHQVCYEVWPESAVVGGRRTMMGYEVELCGVPLGGQQAYERIDMAERWKTFYALRTLALDILRSIDGNGSAIRTYDGSLRAAARRKFRLEIVLTIRLVSLPGNAKTSAGAEHRLEMLQEQFASLGMSRGSWYG